MINFNCGVFTKVTCTFLLQENMDDQNRIILYLENNDYLLHFDLVKVWFQRYRCESGIAIFVWRVNWNYAYSPFNQEKLSFFLRQNIFF